MNGSEHIVRQLLYHGADVDALRVSMNESPLMCAAENGHPDITQLLIKHGANINMQTDRCSAALTVACHFGHLDVAEILLGT